jgi:hypothetical protein
VATGEKPTQRLVEAKIAEFKASGITVPDFAYDPVADLKITSASGRVMYNAGENDAGTPASAGLGSAENSGSCGHQPGISHKRGPLLGAGFFPGPMQSGQAPTLA